MLKSISKCLDLLLIVACLVLSISTFYLYWNIRALRRHASDLRVACETPHLVSGMQVDIQSLTSMLDHAPAQTGIDDRQKTSKVLLIVTSNTCGACISNMPKWQSLIARSSWRVPGKEVWLVSFEKQGILTDYFVEWLKQSNIPFRFLLANDRTTFPLFTGIHSVPATVILTGRGTMNVFCAEELGDKEVEVFQKLLNSDDVVSSQIRFINSSLHSGVVPISDLR